MQETFPQKKKRKKMRATGMMMWQPIKMRTTKETMRKKRKLGGRMRRKE
jgi:hypothetical protein